MERDDKGRFTKKVTDKEIIQAVKKHQPAGTTDIAKEVGIKQPNAYKRLKQLEKENKVKGEMVAKTLVWTIKNEN